MSRNCNFIPSHILWSATVFGWGMTLCMGGCNGGEGAVDDDSALSEGDDDSASPGADAHPVSEDLPSLLACGEERQVTVVMENTGSIPWSGAEGYRLGAVDDSDPFNGEGRVAIPDEVVVPPGETWSFSVVLVAPLEPGSYISDWRMLQEHVQWFGESVSQEIAVECDTHPPRTGLVTLDGHSLHDDQGTFHALGATLMWAAWGYRHDRKLLERNLEFLASHGFDYFRALGVVGDVSAPDYWDGREIDPHWPDYPEVIAGLTDLAYQKYGLRVEWTLIGDGQLTVPDLDDKYALADAFLAMSAGREQEIIHFEIANEYWQNGFDGDDGLQELRDLTVYLRDRTPILVAASAPAGVTCDDALAVYGDGVADLATVHFDRDTSQEEGSWRPVWQPWTWQWCDGVPVASNNEPIGPGSSVASEEDPQRLVAAAITTWVAGLPAYVFHSEAGVRGFDDIANMEGADAFTHLSDLVPDDLPSWDRVDHLSPEGPFVVHAEDGGGGLHADSLWVDIDAPASGAVRAYGALKEDEFFFFPIGILGRLVTDARDDLEFEVWEPVSGVLLETGSLAAGERHEWSGADALIVRGRFTGRAR